MYIFLLQLLPPFSSRLSIIALFCHPPPYNISSLLQYLLPIFRHE